MTDGRQSPNNSPAVFNTSTRLVLIISLKFEGRVDIVISISTVVHLERLLKVVNSGPQHDFKVTPETCLRKTEQGPILPGLCTGGVRVLSLS